jgi:hypothetical protein
VRYGAFEMTQIALSFSTSPVALGYTVGSNTYTVSEQLALAVGNTYTLATTSPQESGPTQYIWSAWSDGGAQSHNITVPATGILHSHLHCVRREHLRGAWQGEYRLADL